MQRILAFETVDRSASIVYQDGETLLESVQLERNEAEGSFVPELMRLLRSHGRPDALAVAQGPGSFTGLRIGCIAARTIAWMHDLPVIGVDTLAAIAAGAGPGLWWVLMPLKRDTTFASLVEIAADGQLEILEHSAAHADASHPQWHPRCAEATAIGPALASKPELAAQWCAGVACGPATTCHASGVARVAAQTPAMPWRELMPRYLQASGPELQRAEGRAASHG